MPVRVRVGVRVMGEGEGEGVGVGEGEGRLSRAHPGKLWRGPCMHACAYM